MTNIHLIHTAIAYAIYFEIEFDVLKLYYQVETIFKYVIIKMTFHIDTLNMASS